MIRGLSGQRYILEVSIFLVTVVLALGIMGCDGSGGGSRALTVTSTAGGVVTSPGEGTFSYDRGTVVNLVATADEGYEFQGWTGDTESVGNPGSLTTTITLNQDSSITANFGATGPHGPGSP